MIELRQQSAERKCPIPHEECNTGYMLQAIPIGVRAKERGEPVKQEVQQEPVVHLFLASAVRRDEGIAG